MYFNRKNAEQKNWRMIKKGKHFLFGCSLVFAIGAALATPTVQADTAEAKVDATVGTAQAEPNAEGPTYAAPAATSPVATEAVEANSATTVVSANKSQLEAVLTQAKAKNLDAQEASVKAEVEAAIAEAEALVANGSASQDQINQSVERLNQAVASVKEVTQAADSSNTPKVRSRRAVEGSVRSVDETNLSRAIVTKENFESFFQEGGTASYDKSSGTIKLTEDVSGQAGNAYLRFKIDPNQDFSFTGKVDIGNKYEGHKVNNRAGGDGVGFVFHTGNANKLGQSGASVGMGGINAAFGFKLDSWHNTSNPNADQNAIADPKYGGRAWESNAFGAFYSSNNAGKVTNISNPAALSPAPSGDWVDFKINYNGTTKEFTVTYGNQTWTTKIDRTSRSMTNEAKNALTARNATYALSFVGSTGSGTNLQRVQIEKFEFTAPQIVHMKFVDVNGNEIEASSAIPGNENEVINLSTQDSKIAAVEAKGYKLKRIDASKAPSYNEANNTVTLNPGGQLLTYVFEEKAKDAAGIKEPETKIPVKDTANLTDDEKAEVKKAVEAANPGAVAEVGQDGTTKVTFPDKSEATLTPAQTVVKAKDAAGIKEPETKTPVKDTANLTDDEKAEVKKAVEAANPGAVAEVGQDGTTKVTFPDKSEATLTPAQTVVKAKDAAGIKEPETKTPVKDTANLTDDEKAEVKKAVEAANPGAVAEVGQDGTTKVTFPDKSEATLTPAQTVVKAKDAAGIKEPETKTPVKDTANLTDDEKAEVKKAVEAANPGAVAEVGQDGTTKVTFPDKSEATLTPAQTVVKAKDAAGIKEPETKTPVKDTANLTDDEKAEVKKAVEAANPGAVAEVGQDGTTKVTFPDKSEATLTPAQTVVKAKDAAGIKEPETKTPVKDTANLTDDEKAEVKKAVEAANPGAVAEVGQDGTTKVTFPDKSEATLTPAQTVVKAKDAAGIKEPETKTPVKDTANLTDDEKAAVKKAVEAANPGSVAEVGQDGTTKVTFPDKSEATLTPAQTVVKAEDEAKQADGVKAPETKTPVKDTANLTDDEKAAVKKAVEAANPGAVAEVGQDGTTKVTFPDKSEATLTPAQTVVKAEDEAKQADGVKAPETKTPVKDTANLTDDEKAAVKKAVEAANPGSVAEVGQDGTTKVTFPDKSEATLTPAQTVVKAEDEAKQADGVKAPETKTPVKDTANLTEDEKAAVKKAVETANPSATKVEVGQDGTTKVTFPDKSEATLTPAQTVVKAKDAAGIKEPETKTPVKDTANLTDDEKAAVKKAVETANPSATKVEVGQDGTTTVTFPDGSEATLKPAQTVVKAEDAAGIKEPATKTPVKDTANLTEDEKAAVKKAVETANPSATKVEVGQDGTTTVTFPDGSEATLKPAQTVVKAEDAAGIKEPATKTPVKDTANLTEDEKAAVKKAVETANPSATKVEVGQDGTTTVTFPDGSEATLKPAQTVVKAEDAAGIKEPATKTPVKDTANLTEDEKAAVKKAVETANPSATKVEVGQDGTTTVTFPDGSEATLKPAQTVVKAEDAAGIKEPATKTPVKDTANLTEDEKAAVKKAVETANPSATKVEVGQDGTTTVTFPDGSEATLKPAQTVVKAEDAAGIKEPATKTPVKDTANLTEDEKAAVKKAVETANPSATKVEVGQDGTTTVTFPDGSEATLKPAQTVVKAEDAAGIKEPATKTPVKDTANLTEDEKAAVKKAVETANPSATKVEVGQDGTTTVTFPDGSEATLKPAQTVVKAEDAAGIKEPATKTPVKDTANLTEDEKAAVKKAVETANPSATKVEVGQDGTTTVTFPDGSEATLKPAQTVVKAEDAAGIKEPATKTPVKDTANLTEDEKAAVKKAVETANPSATKVEVGQDGTTTVTFPDGSEATLKPAQTVVKAEDAAGIKEPATKTPVKDTANLTEDEKAAVKKAVETANPSATKVEVGQDGTTTVTFPDGSEATLKPAQTVVKAEDAAGIKEPATKTPVKDTANLTEDEKAAVKKAVETANPSATKVEVGQDGTTTVTFPDGSEATLKPAQTVVKAEDAAGIKEPATKTPVKDTANLTEDEKAAVKKAVETANPSATKVEVGQDGTTTVTFPDGSEATLKPAQTVVKAEDAAGIKEPATKTPVKDTANLTEDEKAAVKKAVETANPSATKVEVGQDGTTTVTFPDGSEATLKPAQTVVKAEDAAGIKEPATKTPVKDTANLTEDEKAAVKKAVETANPSATKVEVGQDGTTTVTFPDGSEATLKPAQTVVKAEDAAGIKEPATKTPVKDTANLTEDEKAAVKKAVETANPSATKVEVGQDGTTTVTFPDGSEATLKPAQTVVKAEDAAGIKEPATKTPVKDTANLTEDEKAAVKKAVETANPSATKVEVGQDGTTTVTFPDGSEATLKPAQTVVKAEDAAGIKEPATKTPVKDTANLTEDEKAAVKKAVETANPSATKVEVGQDGTTTVTFPDGSEATLKPAQTVVKAEDAAGIKEPATKTPVKDTANLTEDEKAAVKKAVETANPSATKVEVGQDGTTTVTFPDGSEATLKPAQTVVKAEDAAGIKEPATKTPVKDTANLTEDEKAAVKKAVETANPSATKVEVGQDGTTTVTFPDGSEATLKPAQTVVKAEDAAGIKEPATKTPVKDTANLTEDEKAAVKKAVETANPSATKVEVGQDGTTTVTFPDGSEATLKPAQTVVKAEDAAGIKEPATKTPVKDTANLTEDEKAAVKKAVETANPSATKVEVGQDGTTTVTFPDGSEATLKPAQTVAKAAPAAPDVNPVKASDKVVTGKAEPGSSVEVTLPDGIKATATADKDGKFSIPVAGLKAGDKVSVTATDAAGNKSGATDATVAPAAPVVNPVKAGDTAVTGTAEAGSTVEVTLPDGTKATATADKDGKFSIPVDGLKEGDKVSVTATDAAGNKSGATDATVAKAAPVVNPVKAGDKVVTGKAEPGSSVEVTLPDGTKKSATAGEDGTFSIPVDGLKEGDKVSVTATDAEGNKSGATDATVAKAAPAAPVVNDVKEGDKAVTGTAEPGSIVEITLPNSETVTVATNEAGLFYLPIMGLKAGDKVTAVAKDASGNTSTPTEKTVGEGDAKEIKTPVVNPVKAGDTAITGTAEAGSTVEVTLPDGTKATATADKDGKFSIPVDGLKEGDKVSVTATDAAGNKSGATDATVAPAAPVVNPVKAGDTAVTGTAEAGSTVEVTLPDGTKATATADKDGKFSIPVAGLKAGDKVSVTATDAAGNKSGATDATVAPAAPVVNPVKAGDTAVTGTAEAGSTVEVTLPDGTKATATADKDGKFSIPVAGLKAGDKVSVTATDAAGNKSGATDVTVAPAAPVVNPVKAGDTAVTGTAEAGSTVEVTLPDGTKATATADKDGKFSIPVAGLKAGDKVSVTATDAAGNKSGATDATVAPAAPVVNPVKAGDTAVTGTAEAGSTVEVTLPDGTKATATADKDGKFSIPVAGLKAGDKVSVTATDAAGNKSGATDVTVAPAAPVVNPVKAGDTAVTGTAEAGSTVEVTLPDGTKATATADKDGKFSIPVAGLKVGDKVSVTATDAAGNKSGATDATVAPAAPVVNPVKAGDTAVTGTAEAGSTVEVTLPDGTKATTTADKDGKFSIPVDGLKAGDKVSVTATDAAGNKSGATDATVAKATPTAPSANDGKVSEANGAKAPALTPVVDPSNLTDAEKAKIAEEVKKANPTATDIKVNNDGSVVVTFADGSVAVIATEKAVKKATKESSAKETTKKAGAKELPNTGTEQSNVSLGLALLAAVTGGLLISKKRKEEE